MKFFLYVLNDFVKTEERGLARMLASFCGDSDWHCFQLKIVAPIVHTCGEQTERFVAN